jgi:hypothetical protein
MMFELFFADTSTSVKYIHNPQKEGVPPSSTASHSLYDFSVLTNRVSLIRSQVF